MQADILIFQLVSSSHNVLLPFRLHRDPWVVIPDHRSDPPCPSPQFTLLLGQGLAYLSIISHNVPVLPQLLSSSPSLYSLILCLLPRVHLLSSEIKFLLWFLVSRSFFPINFSTHLLCGFFFSHSLSALPWVSFHFILQSGNPGLLLPQTNMTAALYNPILQFFLKSTTNIKMSDRNICHWWCWAGYLGGIMMQQSLKLYLNMARFKISYREKWS